MDEQGGGERSRRAKLLWRLGDELVSSGAKAIEYLEAAAALLEELSDDQSACDAHLRLANYLSVNHVGASVIDVRRAMLHYKKAEAFLATQPESERHALFYVTLGGTYSWTKRISDGLAAAKRAMEIYERLGLDASWSGAAAVSSQLLIFSGSVAEGLRLADQARRGADPINDTMVGSQVAWIGAANYHLLWHPTEGQEWCTSELTKPRTAQTTVQRVPAHARLRNYNVPLLLHRTLVRLCIEAGELTKARASLAEGDAPRKPARLLFFEGDWELADKRLNAVFEQSRRTGYRELEIALDLARLHRFTGRRAQAVQSLRRALEISVGGGDILNELVASSALATMAADAGDVGEAAPHLERCRQIVGAGENWLGVAGSVERAEAVVGAAQAEYAVGETHFKKAIATFQHYRLPWEEADTLQYWGRALLAAGERPRAIEKFDTAIEIYRSRGAGTRFVDYVMVDKRRAQDSKSHHHAT
jgi:tetratricopeptide (TPR) repeat protein